MYKPVQHTLDDSRELRRLEQVCKPSLKISITSWGKNTFFINALAPSLKQ